MGHRSWHCYPPIKLIVYVKINVKIGSCATGSGYRGLCSLHRIQQFGKSCNGFTLFYSGTVSFQPQFTTANVLTSSNFTSTFSKLLSSQPSVALGTFKRQFRDMGFKFQSCFCVVVRHVCHISAIIKSIKCHFFIHISVQSMDFSASRLLGGHQA